MVEAQTYTAAEDCGNGEINNVYFLTSSSFCPQLLPPPKKMCVLYFVCHILFNQMNFFS